MSDSVLFGLCGSSSIFYIDRRESNYPNYIINSTLRNEYRDEYGRKSGRNFGTFHSLSCNKTNANEFAVGTDNTAKIYDFRQMKPCYEFYHDSERLIDRERRCYVSWCPSGKYIYMYQRENLERSLLCESVNCIVWDVSKSERVMSSNDIMVDGTEKKFDWKNVRNGASTWVDGHLLISSLDKSIYDVAPYTETVTPLGNFRDDAETVVDYLEYSKKTHQLAAISEWNSYSITLWSHFKLPPYPVLGMI